MKKKAAKFLWIPLGVEGGLDESNLSAHLLTPLGSADFICLDAGTVLTGLSIAYRNHCFDNMPIKNDPSLTFEGSVLHHHIKAFLITHSYLDHLEGMVVISPNDSKKPIISIGSVIRDIQTHLFNWRIWPNLSDSGTAPAIGLYSYITLKEDEMSDINGTSLRVRAFPLAHGESQSAAFLIESEGAYVLYMGDTGPDEIEKCETTYELWKQIAPLVREQRVHAIFIEASYPDERPDDQLYSHLTPAWLMKAFGQLADIVDPENPDTVLEGLTVVITHIKPDFSAGPSPRDIVKRQLESRNSMGLRLIFAEQGKRYEL